MDNLGQLVFSAKGNEYILAAICNLTQFVQLYPVRDVKATTTVRKLSEFVDRFGASNRIISDRGTAFTPEEFKHFCNTNGTKHTVNSSRPSQANEQVDRRNSTILSAMIVSITDVEGRHWDLGVEKLERDRNSSICKTTAGTPYKMLYRYLLRFQDGLSRRLTEICGTYRMPEEIRAEGSKKIEIEQ